jgi:hypothetical protein
MKTAIARAIMRTFMSTMVGTLMSTMAGSMTMVMAVGGSSVVSPNLTSGGGAGGCRSRVRGAGGCRSRVRGAGGCRSRVRGAGGCRSRVRGAGVWGRMMMTGSGMRHVRLAGRSIAATGDGVATDLVVMLASNFSSCWRAAVAGHGGLLTPGAGCRFAFA